MKRKKSVLTIIICLLLIFGITACNSSQKPADSGDKMPDVTETVEEPKPTEEVKATEEPKPTEDETGPKEINGGKPVKLLINFAMFTPSLNEKPTAEQPTVFRSSQKLADEFMRLHPNVTIEWDRRSPGAQSGVSGEQTMAEFITTQVAAGTAADIHGGLNGAANYSDRGWFMPLDDILDTPNEYVEGNGKWRDMFPDYAWNHVIVSDAQKRVLAIPLSLYPGPPTAYYYNKEIFEKVEVQVPKDWEDFFTVCKKIKDAGYIAFAPNPGNVVINSTTWDVQFSLGRVYAAALQDNIDYDKNGVFTPDEKIRAIKEGYFDARTNDYAKELWQQTKRKYVDVFEKGYENTDYGPLWNAGKVAMLEDGIWRLPSEMSNTKRTFEFGLFPPPVITQTTSKYVAPIEYTEKGPYQPQPSSGFVIMNPSIEAHGGEGVREAAIAFLKFVSKPENLSMMILEGRGSWIGAVKGTEIPPELNDWFSNPFPILPNFDWNVGDYATSEYRDKANKQLQMWLKGMIDDETFYKNFDTETQKGHDVYIKKTNIDTSGWNIKD